MRDLGPGVGGCAAAVALHRPVRDLGVQLTAAKKVLSNGLGLKA